MRLIVGNNKGGVGKDLIAAGLYHAALLAGVSPAALLLLELESSARLAAIYPEAVTIVVDLPTPAALYADPDAVYAALDRAADLWNQPQVSITSLGANVTGALLTWCAKDGLGSKVLNRPDTIFVIALTMNRHALSSGLTNLYEIGQTLPAAKRVAVLNDIHANFMDNDKFLAKRLEEARGDGMPIETLRLTRCSAPAWGYAQNLGILAEIAALDPDVLIRLGLPEGPGRRSMPIIASWIKDSLIDPLTTLFPADRPKKRAK